VDRKALCKLWGNRSLHSKVVDIMEAIYANTSSCISVDDVIAVWSLNLGGIKKPLIRWGPDVTAEGLCPDFRPIFSIETEYCEL